MSKNKEEIPPLGNIMCGSLWFMFAGGLTYVAILAAESIEKNPCHAYTDGTSCIKWTAYGWEVVPLVLLAAAAGTAGLVMTVSGVRQGGQNLLKKCGFFAGQSNDVVEQGPNEQTELLETVSSI